ncbi:MAG: hypothetical protein QM723_00270 [Myxococcaceae bacterium]
MKLFLPQRILEEWSSTEKADLSEGKLVVSDPKSSHPVSAGVHFVKVVSGNDTNNLVGRVKSMSQLDELGAEHMADSVILGETAYEVEPGYLTEVPAEVKAKGPDPKKKPISPEADLLAAFILDKL